MATLNLPAATVRDSELALAELYRDRLAAIAADAPAELAARAASLDARLDSQGYSDLLADDVERLAAEHLARSTAQLGWLIQSDEGHALTTRTLAHLEQTARAVRHLSDRLASTQDANDRRALGESLRRHLGDHRQTFRRVLELAGPDAPVTGTGQLTFEAVDLSLTTLEQSIAETTGEPEPVQTGLASIDVARMMARHATGVRPVEDTERTLAAESDHVPVDPGLTELLRARLDAADTQAPAASPRLAELDAALERASRQYGASYAVSTALARVSAPSGNARSNEVAELAVLRANLYAERLAVFSHVKGANADRMRDRHAALHAEAQQLTELAAAGSDIPETRIAELASGLADDARAVSRTSRLPATVVADLQTAAAAAASRLRGLMTDPGVAFDALDTHRADATADTAQARAQLQTTAAAQLAETPSEDRSALSDRVQQAVDQGARQDAPARFAAIATDRLLARSRVASYGSLLPSFGAARVLVHEETDVSPMGDDGASDQRAYSAGAGLASTAGARRAAIGSDGGAPVATEVHQRLDRASSLPGGLDALQRGLAQMGTEVARSLSSLSGLFEAGLRSTRPLSSGGREASGVAPRMAAAMPSNIFANTSGDMMQQVYLPALSRLAGVRTQGPAPAAEAPRPSSDRFDQLASPDALLHAMLGDSSRSLALDHPDVARRVQGQIARIAAMMPNAGAAGRDILSRYSTRMRQRVDAWMADDSGAPRFVAHEHDAAAPTSGPDRAPAAARGLDTETARARTASALRGESMLIHPSILRRIESLIGRSMTGVEAFAGQTAGQIARDMGAKGFTVGRKMFFDPSMLNLGSAEGEGLLAHELTHAALGSMGGGRGEIAAEERLAYGVQDIVQSSTASTVEARIAEGFQKMEIARELPSSSSAASMLAQPSVRAATAPGARQERGTPGQAKPTDAAGDETDPLKNEDLMAEILEVVSDLMREEIDLGMERLGEC